METTSPPITPIRQYMSSLETSPTYSYREQLRRRTSSFSSNHDRSSPVSLKKNRFSNASQYSNDFSPIGGEGGGLGNLADELDQLDDDDDVDYDEDISEDRVADDADYEMDASTVDGARDSGVDVSYISKRSSPHPRNFSKPFSAQEKPPDEEIEDANDKLSPELEDALSNIARMASYSSTSEDPLIPRVVALLQDLGNQSNLEAHAQRFTTSTNSMTSHLATQSKTLQSISATLYSPFAFLAPLDSAIIDESTPLIEALLKDLPLPDPAPLKGMQKLGRDTADVVQILSQLTDTLQMGKQTTNTASRHLRTTQTMVADLRRERERAEEARDELSRTNWNERIRERYCAGQCEDILGGFESVCDSLRARLSQRDGVIVV